MAVSVSPPEIEPVAPTVVARSCLLPRPHWDRRWRDRALLRASVAAYGEKQGPLVSPPMTLAEPPEAHSAAANARRAKSPVDRCLRTARDTPELRRTNHL